MSKEVVKAIFDENIAGVREDLTFDAYFDSIKGNEEYKKGLFENYVNDGTKSYEEFNAETFGVGKPEAPSEVGGAESSPTGLGLNESEVGPPAGGTPPGAEPVGAPVSDAIEPVEPEAPAVTVGLEEFSVIDNKKNKGFLETIFGWLGGEKTFERVEKPFEELVPAQQRLFKKGASKKLSEQIGGVFAEAEKSNEPEKIVGLASKGYLSTNTFADYLAGDFARDKAAAEEINVFLEKGVEGQSEAFKRFKGNIDPIIAEQSNEIKETMLKDRAYINLNKEIDREFASQRAEIDAKYIGVINAEKQAKLKEDTVGLLAEYDAVMLSLPTKNDVLAKKNEMLAKYQLLVNDGKMDVDAANAELEKERGAYIEDIKAKATEANNAYNSGLEKAAEKIKSGLKDTEEYKQYISELTELRNGIITSREGDLKAIQARIQGDLAPKYNERINSVIRASSSGPTPLLEKSGLLPTIQKVINNKGFDLLPFDQKKAFLDRAFGNVVVQLREKGVAINDGTVAQARNEFDDAVMSKAYFTQKGTPSLYMLKTRAIEEAEKLDEVIASEKKSISTQKGPDAGTGYGEFTPQSSVGSFTSKSLRQLQLAREKLQEIIDLPESMTDNEFKNFWNGLSSGQFIDYLPFVSGLKNLAGSLALYRSLEDDTPASRYLQNAVALGNSYKGVYEANNMASDWYKSGTSTVESIPFMGEFVFTAGMSSVARKSTEKFLIKLFGGATEKTVAGKGMRVLAGTLVGALAQTTANPQRYIDETIKRMTPQMSMIFSEEGDDLIAMLDESTAEGGFEAFLKGYGVTASEYFSENLGFAGARALRYAGSKMMQNEFLKRLVVGYYMSKLNIDMPTAVKRLAGAAGYNGLPMELVEEIFNKPLTNLITGDADVMAGILTESGDLDIENLMEVVRALVPISAVGVGANVGGVAVKSMTPENVTISYRDINNLPATETIDRGVWDKVTEALKSPDKLREFISNELPRLKVEGKAREIITRELESGLSRFEGGVVESTKPPQAKGAAETQPAPKVSVQMVERKRLSADKKRLVGTGKFDFVVTIDGKEQNISRAEYNEYKRSGKLPEGIGADVLGEVDRVEGVVVESTKDAESIKTSLEGVEVPAELGTIENVAEVYDQAKGKEELTDEEVAVVDFVEGNVAKVEGVVEATPEVETAVSPLQYVESTTKALEGVEQEKLNSVKEKLSKAEISKFESDERKQTTTRADRGVQEVQPPSERDLGGREVSQPDRGFNSVSTGEEWERGEQYNGDGKVPSSNGKPVITVLYHGHKAPFDSFSREYRGSGIGNQGGGVYFLVRPSEALATAERVARFGGYGLNRKEATNSTPFVSKVKIKGNNFVFLDKPIPKDIVAQIGVINGIDPSKYNTYSAFLYDLVMSFVTDKKNFTDHSEAQTKAADELYKKGITGHASSNIKDYEVAVYDESEIEKISQTRIYNSNAELISDQYHKAKADNSNPELVKAVEDLLGVTPEAVTPEAVTTEVPGAAEVAETQPSAETPTQPLTLKEKAKEAKQKADEAAEKIKRLLGGRNGGLGISPFGRAKRLAEIDRAVVVALASYVRNKVLAGAYTFQDFVKDMKENSKRMFGVEIRVTAQDELFFNQAASMYEIDDAFAGEIMGLKDDFIFSIAAMSGRINMNFEEFVASNQSLVDQFMDSAERNYGLNAAQAETLVRAMYQDALRAAANRDQLYKTEADIKNYQENAILGNRAFQDVSNSNKAVEVARRSNSISRLYDGFLRAFVTPTLSFDRVFRLSKDRLSLEREVYASRKSRMGASTKAANWYSDVQKKIFGGLSWGQLERLNEYIIAKRILDVEEKRNQDVAYSIKLNEELADPATTDDRKAEIKEELAKLGNLGEIKHGSAMLNGKKVELTVDFAQGVIDANSGLDTKSIEIRERAEAYRKANDELLKMRLDAGLISQAAYDSMIKRDYVRRIFLDLSASTIDAVDYPSISAKIKAIQEGSTDKSLEMDTQTLLQLNAAATFDAVAKNNFINKVAKWTESNQQAFLDKALEKFKNKFEKKNGRQPTDDEIQKFLKEQTLFELIRNNQTPKSGFEKVSYFVDGVEKSIAVRSDLAGVFQTASGRSPVQNKQLISVMSKLNLTGLIKASAVFFNPAFALGNFALDVVHASMVTRDLYKSFSANLGLILAKALGITAENVYSKAVNYGGALFGMAKRDSKFDRLVKDYFAHGGGMTFMSEIGSKMYTKRMAQSQLGKAKSVAVDNANKIISVFNSIQSGSELITRVIIYEAALEKNVKEYKKQNGIEPTGADLTSIKESAAASAADLIDFREGTNTTKGLDQTFMPFLNAMVQGARAEIDFITKNPAVAATRLAEFGGMTLAVALYNAKSGEDDEKEGIIGYNGVSEYIRANYFVMMMPWTKKNEKGEVVRPYVSIKLPAMLKSINIFVEGTVSSRGASEVTSQMAEALKGGYVPEIGAASPTAQAVFALTANKDFFRKGAKVYRGKEEVLLPERFNIGETKKIYRDLFGAAYDLMNEEGEDKGVLGFNEAGPAQWQAAIEKAISSNNPYYLGITSGYANISGLYGEKNQKEVDALYDDKLAALNSLTMRVYRTPQSSVQNSNSKKKEEFKFLEKQIGSWQQRNTNTIKGVVSKELREISESGKEKGVLLDRFFDQKIFNYISDAELIKEAKKAGIKKLPENLDDIQEFIKDEQSRMSIQLVEAFKPNFIFRHPSLKEYDLAKNSYVGFNEDLISGIEKEYDNAKDGESYLIALKFVAGDDYDEIAKQIGVNPIEKMRVDNILKTPSAYQYKTAYFRRTNVSSNEVSSESAINNLILLKYLLENE